MSTNHGSNKVIFIAFIANLLIATAKFAGALLTKSASLLAESIHSLVDCTNQILLLVGNKKSQKPPDEKHPLGYGRESFFWSFMVAILLFSLGGVFAIYEGIHKLNSQEELGSPIVGLSILLLSIALEAYSFWSCLLEVKLQKGNLNYWQWFRQTSQSDLLVIFTEDAAALCGLIIATVFLGLTWLTGNVLWDAIGSIVVGSLLVIVAVLLALEIKAFIIGEAPSDEIKLFVTQHVPRFFPEGQLLRFIGLQTGSHEVMVSYKIHPGKTAQVSDVIKQINALESLTKKKFPQIKWQFVEIDDHA